MEISSTGESATTEEGGKPTPLSKSPSRIFSGVTGVDDSVVSFPSPNTFVLTRNHRNEERHVSVERRSQTKLTNPRPMSNLDLPPGAADFPNCFSQSQEAQRRNTRHNPKVGIMNGLVQRCGVVFLSAREKFARRQVIQSVIGLWKAFVPEC